MVMNIGYSNLYLSQLDNLEGISKRLSCDFKVCKCIELKEISREDVNLKDKQVSLWSRKVAFD